MLLKPVKLLVATAVSLAAFLCANPVSGQSNPSPYDPSVLGPFMPPDTTVTDGYTSSDSNWFGRSMICDQCGHCSWITNVTTQSNSIFFSMDLGRTPFERKTNFIRSAVAPAMAHNSLSRILYRRPFYRDFPDIRRYYLQQPTSARRAFKLWLDEETVGSSIYLPSILQFDQESLSEKISNAGAIRQIVTDDLFADIQPLSAVYSSLPTDIQSLIPSHHQGFLVRTWWAEQAGAVGGSGLHALPTASTDPVGWYVFYNPDPSPSAASKLSIIQRAKFGGSVYKTKGWTWEQGTSHDWTSRQYAGLPGTGLIQETTLTNNAWTTSKDFTQIRTVKTAPVDGTGALGSSLMTVASIRENFDDFGGVSRLAEKVEGWVNGSDSGERTTKYAWFDNPADSITYGRLKWQYNPDASFEYYTYSGFNATGTAGTVVKYTPWKNYKWTPGATAPIAANCITETTTILSTSQIEVVTQTGGTETARRSETWSTDPDGTQVLTVRTYTAAGVYLTSATGYHPPGSSLESGKIAWEEFQDGTAAKYSYTAGTGSVVWTESKDKGEGSRSGVTKGFHNERDFNSRGEEIGERSYYRASASSTVLMSSWEADSVDYFGRVTECSWNGDGNDLEKWEYGCCGLKSYTDRKGIVIEDFQDNLRRKYKTIRTAGSHVLTRTTQFHEVAGGIAETTQVTGSLPSAVAGTPNTAFLKETVTAVNGEIVSLSLPDQNGDSAPEITSYSYQYSSGAFLAGRQVTTLYPDGGQTVTIYQVDGKIQSVSGSAAHPTSYSYGTWFSGGADGNYIKATHPVAADATSQWEETYYDRAGRETGRNFPNGLGTTVSSSVSYYDSTAGAGAKGNVNGRTDADSVTYGHTYSADSLTSSESSPLPNSTASLSMQFTLTATTLAPYGLDQTSSGPVWAQNYQRGGVLVRTVSTGGYGWVSGETRFNRTTIRKIKPQVDSSGVISGSWTDTTVYPDATTTVRVYADGLLQTETRKDTSNVLLSSHSYIYDALGRPAQVTDSRSGSAAAIYYKYNQGGSLISALEAGGRGAIYGYDKMGRRVSIDSQDSSGTSLGQISHTSYNYDGTVKATWGRQIYPIFRTYDWQGRLLTLSTYQQLSVGAGEPDGSAAVGKATTTWTYNPWTGRVENKSDPAGKSMTYIYTNAGRLSSRGWARGVSATYGYDDGYLASVVYSDDTPDVSMSYDSLGRRSQVKQTDTSVTPNLIQSKYDYTYSATWALDTETVSYLEQSAGGFALVRVIDHSEDTIGRSTGFDLKNGSLSDGSLSVNWSPTTGRLATITAPNIGTFTYSYVPGSDLLEAISSAAGVSRSYAYDSARELLDVVNNKIGSTIISTYNYTVNDMWQRSGVTASGSYVPTGTGWTWSYDDRGELKQADSGVSGNDRAYEYDSIGNRKKAVDNLMTSLPSTDNYTTNELNQYTLVTGTSTAPTFDFDGNELSGPVTNSTGTLVNATGLTWDAENRLISLNTPGSGAFKYRYDPFGRRILKRNNSNFWDGFVYDGWNEIAQYYMGAGANSPSPAVSSRWFNVWGPDLSGSWQGAGGVGGLLAVRGGQYGANYYPAYDGSGNITDYIKVWSGVPSHHVHFEYDCYGRTVSLVYTATNDVETGLFYRFGTNKFDGEMGLYYYGFRYYDPNSGKWVSRDPIGEQGGLNLYGAVSNDFINKVDTLGDAEVSVIGIGHLDGMDPRSYADDRAQKEMKRYFNYSYDLQGNAEELGQTVANNIKDGDCIKTLVLNGHGVYDETSEHCTRIEVPMLNKEETLTKFADKIKGKLCDDAKIYLMVCFGASHDNALVLSHITGKDVIGYAANYVVPCFDGDKLSMKPADKDGNNLPDPVFPTEVHPDGTRTSPAKSDGGPVPITTAPPSKP